MVGRCATYLHRAIVPSLFFFHVFRIVTLLLPHFRQIIFIPLLLPYVFTVLLFIFFIIISKCSLLVNINMLY